MVAVVIAEIIIIMIIIMSMKQPKKTLLSYRLMQTNMQ